MAEKLETYLDKNEAREVLARMGRRLTAKQIEHATGPDIDGRRKLPFFLFPIAGKLLIAESELIAIYGNRQRVPFRHEFARCRNGMAWQGQG